MLQQTAKLCLFFASYTVACLCQNKESFFRVTAFFPDN